MPRHTRGLMLPPLIEVEEIFRRLSIIFPEGTANRNYVTRRLAARVIFVMLYVGAVEGEDSWAGPIQVYRFGNQQSLKRSDDDRRAYIEAVRRRRYETPPDRWFQDNTRESIRDETWKDGLVALGAVVTKPGVPTTSSLGRYALQLAFLKLFDPTPTDGALAKAATDWQEENLSASGLARVRLQQFSASAAKTQLLVMLPGGDTRRMEAGPSSVITKAVIEVFAPRFLKDPAVLWVSESGNKVVKRDDDLAKSLGIEIKADRLLPDIILVDLGLKQPLILFIEVVHSDGPISEGRRKALTELAVNAGFRVEQIAFTTAFQGRNVQAFRKAVPELSWGSFAWCVNEPDNLIAFDGVKPAGVVRLADFLAMQHPN